MMFYNKCLGGEFTFQTIGESPLSDKMPAKMKDCILHAELKKDSLVILASDMVGENGLIKGNSVSLMLNCSSEKEMQTFYSKLASGRASVHPFENTFRGALFGGITDKFGNNWLLHFDKKQNQ